MTERPLTFMAVHAHPDDEATGTGGVLARYADEGIETVLVTCTDGRCGDGPGGAKPGEPGHDPEQVIALRQRELEASCALLGVTHLEQLGYADSGMMGWPANDAPGSFWSTPVAEAAEPLAELMRRYRPDVVVTYDENGFYGHPDHIQANRITVAALERSGIDAKLYWLTAPRSTFEALGAAMRAAGVEWDDGEAEPDPDAIQIGSPDEQITSWVDVTAYTKQKYDALAAHASQGENIGFLAMGRDMFAEFFGTETFIRVRPIAAPADREHDLFAGLR